MQKLIFILFLCLSAQSYAQSTKPRHQSSPEHINGLYKFSGKLNNKIPVFIWFIVKDSVLKGEVTYLNTHARQPITIAGTIILVDKFNAFGKIIERHNGALIYEFNKNGYITGTYMTTFKGTGFEGTWSKPGSEKELPFHLLHSDSVLSKRDTVLTSNNIPGEYLYRFGEKGSQGGIDIKQTDKTNFLISINCTTAGPSYNVANVEPVNVHMVGNSFIYRVPDTDCKFKISFFDNFAVITQLKGTECGFGLNASIDGVFIKTSNNVKMQ